MVDITTGGTRDRLIFDSAAKLVHDMLDQLGWLNMHPSRQQLVWRDTPVPDGEQVPLNTVAVSDAGTPLEVQGELGSLYAEVRTPLYVDFYAESDDLARAVTGDIRDGLKGKMPSIGRTWPNLRVFDLTQDPVPGTPAFILEVENVEVDRVQRDGPKPHEEHWFVVRFELVDNR